MQTLSKDTYKPDQSSGEGGGIAAYLALLGKLRKAGDLEELRYVIVNNSRPTLHYRQAFLLELRASTWRVSCVSSLATFEANAPLIRHIEKVVSRTHDMSKRLDIKINDIDTQSNCATPTSPFESAILQPLLDRDGQCLAVLLCAREKPWREEEAPLLDEVADAASHAWNALRAPQVRKSVFVWKRSRTWIAGLLACLLIACIPVPMTALAPAEVTAADMVVIAAPIDGVVGELPVAPNSQVKKG